MAYVFDTKICRNQAEAAWYLMRHAVDNAGWTLGKVGGGTGSGLNATGTDIFTTVDIWMAQNLAYFTLIEPGAGARRSYLFVRGTNDTAMRVMISWDVTGFTGGDEDTPPTATDEQQWIGVSGNVKSSFLDNNDAFVLQLIADTTPGGENGVNDAYLLGFVAKTLGDFSGTQSDFRIFGAFPLRTFPGTDVDPCCYIDSWTGLKTTNDMAFWFHKGGAGATWLTNNSTKQYYQRTQTGETQPGNLAGPLKASERSKSTYGRITVARGNASGTQAFFKGVLQDILWSYQQGSTRAVGYPSTLLLPAWLKPGGVAADTHFMRSGDDLLLPWDPTNQPAVF